ncbi:MAG: glycoside hydrolase family 3 C-terminal domain-containing protein, partial [Treponemataceae bacterium]|nr:glycoside hydrolase family 3 C-terminal domain-containing protein [Treponemataceae bacterium]
METKLALKNLTLDEKIRLLNGVGSWSTYNANGKLPVIFMSDGPHGLRKQDMESYSDINDSKISTCFPTASCLASSWNRETIALVAKTIGEEAVAENVDIVLGCGLNIKRSPLCGRNFEYFSEDPYLSGELATSYVNGLQSTGTGASIKHFAANNQEKRRQTSDSIIDERALREIYLYAFEKTVKESAPATVMESYNKLNGEYVSRSHRLLQEILRDEWSFDGVVVSDWGAAINIAECIKGGLDLAMPDSCGFHTEELKAALAEGKITEADIDRAVENIIQLAKRLKPEFFDARESANGATSRDDEAANGAQESVSSSYEANRTTHNGDGKVADGERSQNTNGAAVLRGTDSSSSGGAPSSCGISPELFAKAHEIAKTAACDSAVLLKNDGMLPIRQDKTLSASTQLGDASAATSAPNAAPNPGNTTNAAQPGNAAASDATVAHEKLDNATATPGEPSVAQPTIVIIGEMARTIRFQGGGSSHITTNPITDAVKAFENKGFKVLYEPGYSEELAAKAARKAAANKTLSENAAAHATKAKENGAKPTTDAQSEKLAAAAVQLAEKAAASNIPVLFFCGLTDRFEGEGFDRETLDIPAEQSNLLQRVVSTGASVAAVTFSGSPISLPFADDVNAILHMYLAGEASAEACADLITGDANPAGKLAETFPLALHDIPCAQWFAKETDTVEYRESIFVGYRYYETFNVPVKYEFGYGLSYTTFEYSDLKITPPAENAAQSEVSPQAVADAQTDVVPQAGAA